MYRSPGRYFDDHASAFDSIYGSKGRVSRWINRTFRRAVYERFEIALRHSGDVEGKSVLDIGCGSGRYMIEYVRRGAGRVVGIDFSSEMLGTAADLIASHGARDRCELVSGDFLEYGFRERFDIVLAMGVFDYVQDGAGFLNKMASLSRETVIASFPGRSFPRMHLRKIRYRIGRCPVFFYEEEDIRRLLPETGIRSSEILFMPHSGTGYVLVARKGPDDPEPPG